MASVMMLDVLDNLYSVIQPFISKFHMDTKRSMDGKHHARSSSDQQPRAHMYSVYIMLYKEKL